MGERAAHALRSWQGARPRAGRATDPQLRDQGRSYAVLAVPHICQQRGFEWSAGGSFAATGCLIAHSCAPLVGLASAAVETRLPLLCALPPSLALGGLFPSFAGSNFTAFAFLQAGVTSTAMGLWLRGSSAVSKETRRPNSGPKPRSQNLILKNKSERVAGARQKPDE